MELQSDVECNVHARIARVAQVINAINFDDINILRVQPVRRPRLSESEPVAAVLEAAISRVVGLVNAKPMLPAEIRLETIGWNAAVIAAVRLGLRLLCTPFLGGALFVLHGFFWLRFLVFFFFLRRLGFFLLLVLLLLCVRWKADSDGQR